MRAGRTVSCSNAKGVRAAFTLVELLVVVAIIAILIAITMPAMRGARQQARAVVCGSNIRQVAVADAGYATEYNGRFCPGAIGIRTSNLHRWHGVREDTHEPFKARGGPLTPFLTENEGIRACPSLREIVTDAGAAFERGCGGYGYNQAYLGRVLSSPSGGSFAVRTDACGVQSERVRRPADTMMFADAAFAVTGGVIEYSFAEPRFHPEYLRYNYRPDPSIHFRHRGEANVAWCDGHVSRSKRTKTYSSGMYRGDPDSQQLGWFGEADDNSLFDLE